MEDRQAKLKTAGTETARSVAFAVLDEARTSNEFATQLLDRRLAASGLAQADRRLATELVAGTVRRRLTLDTLLERHVSRPRQCVEVSLWTLLQLGTYQLLFVRGIPPHAAVHETVELARRIGRPNWTGMINAVLRSLSRMIADAETTEPGPSAVALTAGRYRLLVEPAFPDPQRDPAGYIARAFSFPRWLTERWLPRFGRDESLRIAFWFNEPHGLSLRVNPLRASRDELLAMLVAAGVDAIVGDGSDSIRVAKATGVTSLPGFADGCWTVQDESAMAVSRLLAPQPGETVLDLCAAPGTKTTHLAELMRDSGRIIATDVSGERLQRIAENARRLRLTSIEPLLISPDLHDVPAGPFDAVLVDAPCSNTGVLGKRPEARWRIQPQDIVELAALQQRLLHAAADRVKPGGRLVYSTCSLEPEENEGIIAAVLEDRFDLRLEEQHATLPGQPSDGGFRAKFVRLP